MYTTRIAIAGKYKRHTSSFRYDVDGVFTRLACAHAHSRPIKHTHAHSTGPTTSNCQLTRQLSQPHISPATGALTHNCCFYACDAAMFLQWHSQQHLKNLLLLLLLYVMTVGLSRPVYFCNWDRSRATCMAT